MTRRTISHTQANTNLLGHPKHNVPTFNPPLYKFCDGRILIDNKDFTESPTFIEEDLALSQQMSLILEDKETLRTDRELSESTSILVYDDANGTLVYEHTEILDDELYQNIEMKDIFNHLHAGSYTMYLSNIEYDNIIDELFEYQDNATIFTFKILSREEVLREPAPHQFAITPIGQSLPMLADGIRLDYVNEEGATTNRNFYCFNGDGVAYSGSRAG